MKINSEPMSFSKYGKSFQEKLCMVILDDRAFADQIEEVLDVNFLELNYLKCFLNKVFDYRKKYEVHPSRDIMKTILRSELDNENEEFDIPPWLGKEVTADYRYLNSNLAKKPFNSW